MKILEDEIKRRYEERRTAKTSLWSNLLVKIILIAAVIIIIRYASEAWDIFSGSNDGQNDIELIQ